MPASFGIPRTLWSQYALFEYIGSFPGHKPHGNSHTDDIYIRTTADTLEKINTHIKTQKPKDVYRDLLANDVTTDHNAPRDLKQVQNQKYLDRKKQRPQPSYSACNSADHMLSALSLVNDNPFVQQVIHAKDEIPTFILYSEDTIEDLKCTLKHHPDTVIGIDRTFNLGEIFVTTTIFKHPAVVRKSNDQNPIFFGPLFLHGNATTETYNVFFSHLATKLKDFPNIIFGTDEEHALTNALEMSFPKPTRILCVRHLKNNTIAFLQDKIAIGNRERKLITDKLFGENGASTADDSGIFETTIDEVDELCSNIAPSFCTYLRNKLKSYFNTLFFQKIITTSLEIGRTITPNPPITF